MKALLIFPPQAYPANPYMSVPLLAGQLKNAGYDVTALDLNVKFFNDVLNSKYLSALYEDIKKMPQIIEEKIKETKDNNSYKYLLEKKQVVEVVAEKVTFLSSKKAD